MTAATMNKMRVASEEYREARELPVSGVVVWHNGVISGWSSLSTPDGWVPGCVGVWPNGDFTLAVGGDYQRGAVEWAAVNKEGAK